MEFVNIKDLEFRRVLVTKRTETRKAYIYAVYNASFLLNIIFEVFTVNSNNEKIYFYKGNNAKDAVKFYNRI